jgi:hypothetical protein
VPSLIFRDPLRHDFNSFWRTERAFRYRLKLLSPPCERCGSSTPLLRMNGEALNHTPRGRNRSLTAPTFASSQRAVPGFGAIAYDDEEYDAPTVAAGLHKVDEFPFHMWVSSLRSSPSAPRRTVSPHRVCPCALRTESRSTQSRSRSPSPHVSRQATPVRSRSPAVAAVSRSGPGTPRRYHPHPQQEHYLGHHHQRPEQTALYPARARSRSPTVTVGAQRNAMHRAVQKRDDDARRVRELELELHRYRAAALEARRRDKSLGPSASPARRREASVMSNGRVSIGTPSRSTTPVTTARGRSSVSKGPVSYAELEERRYAVALTERRRGDNRHATARRDESPQRNAVHFAPTTDQSETPSYFDDEYERVLIDTNGVPWVVMRPATADEVYGAPAIGQATSAVLPPQQYADSGDGAPQQAHMLLGGEIVSIEGVGPVRLASNPRTAGRLGRVREPLSPIRHPDASPQTAASPDLGSPIRTPTGGSTPRRHAGTEQQSQLMNSPHDGHSASSVAFRQESGMQSVAVYPPDGHGASSILFRAESEMPSMVVPPVAAQRVNDDSRATPTDDQARRRSSSAATSSPVHSPVRSQPTAAPETPTTPYGNSPQQQQQQQSASSRSASRNGASSRVDAAPPSDGIDDSPSPTRRAATPTSPRGGSGAASRSRDRAASPSASSAVRSSTPSQQALPPLPEKQFHDPYASQSSASPLVVTSPPPPQRLSTSVDFRSASASSNPPPIPAARAPVPPAGDLRTPSASAGDDTSFSQSRTSMASANRRGSQFTEGNESASTAGTAAAPLAANQHRVKRGESWRSIAILHMCEEDELRALNAHMGHGAPVGEVIEIPD